MLLASISFAIAAHSPTDFADSWSTVRKSIENRYYARKANHDRMASLLDKYEPKAKSAGNEAEFSKAVNDMIVEFGDSHFGLFTKSDQSFYMMDSLVRNKSAAEMPSIGAWFKPAGDGYTIQMLLEESSAAKAGLRKGDVVIKVDGAPFTPIDSLQPKIDHKAHLSFLRSGMPMEADVDVEKTTGTNFFLQPTKDSARIIDFGGKHYGYIHLWTMASDDFRNALNSAVYGKLKDTDGFILDIRDGFGGRPEGFGDPFYRPDADLKWDSGTSAYTQKFGYGKPLVVLINKGSRSAKEVFAHLIKKARRATLVGERTGGNVLGTSPAAIGDWAYIEIPMVDVIIDGVRLERVGVAPDVKVDREFDDSGKDLFIDQALKVLSKQAGKSR